MTNCPLLMAVGAAYVPTTGDPLGYLVQERILGMPPGLSQERYNLDARIADSDAEAWRDPVQRQRCCRHSWLSGASWCTSRDQGQVHLCAGGGEEWAKAEGC